MRMYQLFKTIEERKEWEIERKQKNPNFRVCMRMTAKQLAKDLYMPKETVSEYRYATVWTTDKY